MKKQPEITEKTRQAFIDVFCELYCQKPIEKISIQEIANKSGYNRSTFYQYFTDIYEMATYIENDILSYIKNTMQNGDMANQPIADKILFLFEKKGNCLNALLGDYGSIRFLERIKKEIFPYEQEQSFIKDNPLTPYLVEFHLSISFSLFRLWIRRERDLSPDELFDLIQNLYLKGVTSIM
jgi:AcrR family transcriptional regulator